MSDAFVLLSGFSDEAAIDKTLDQQFAALSALGLRYFSMRFVDVGTGIKNAMQLNNAESELVLQKMRDYGMSVASLGSPLGKVKLLDVDDGTAAPFRPFQEYLADEVPRACELAQRFGTRLIRGFSFYHPRGSDLEAHFNQAVDQVARIVEQCAVHGLTYGLEVEANLVGQTGQLLARMHRAIDHPSLVLIFDGGNLVTQGFSEDEIFQQYEAMKPGLGWLHVKDFSNPQPGRRIEHVDEDALQHYVPATIGDSGYLRILTDLKSWLPELHRRMTDRGVPGVFLDLEPHVKGGGQFGGFSGPDGFGVALRSLCELLNTTGIGYRLRAFDDIRQDRGF